MRAGIVHHLGWAVAVTASAGHVVVDRRRIALVEPGMPAAPVEHHAGSLDDGAAARLVAEVRASALRATSVSLEQLAGSLPGPVVSVSLRAWPLDFPGDIAVQRRPPYQSRADSVMYCQVLAECAHDRGWEVHLFGAKDVQAQARRILGERAGDVLGGQARRSKQAAGTRSAPPQNPHKPCCTPAGCRRRGRPAPAPAGRTPACPPGPAASPGPER